MLFLYFKCAEGIKDKATDFVEQMIASNLPKGCTYSSAEMFVDSVFSHPIFLSDVRDAAMNIQDLRQDLEKCNTAFKDSIALNFIKETETEITHLQQGIREKALTYKSGVFCGCKITVGYHFPKEGKDSFIVLSCITDKKMEGLLIDDIMTQNLALEYLKLKEIIDESLNK